MNRDRRSDAGTPGAGKAIAAESPGVPGKTTLTSMLSPIPSSTPKTTSDASHDASTGGAIAVQRKTTIDGVVGPLPREDARPTPQAAIDPEDGASPSPSNPPNTMLPTAGPRRAPSLQLTSTPAPVQRKATGDAPAAAPADIAARGVEGGGGSLPHLAQIQASFGRHDVSGVTAHQGTATSGAAQALGASAFAFGNAVGFDGAPDLHTAAHEAAHVVQQRGGVQLKGGVDGGAADPLERHADAVADAVVRGESAEHMLDATHGATGAAAGSAVQRKPDAATSSTAHDEGPPTKAVPHAKWPVFDDTGLPYKIVSAKEPVRFWTVSDWVRSRAERFEGGGHAVSSACAAEIFEALGWVPKDKIKFAAARVVFDITRRVAEHQVDASAFYVLGLPTSRPVASHAVSSKGDHIVQVATRLPDPDVPAGTRVDPDDAQRLDVIRALASFTGLAPASGALDALRNDPRFHDKVVQSGVVLWDIDATTGNDIFGFDDDDEGKTGPYTRWLKGSGAKDEPRSGAHDKPKLKLNNYYGVPIPGTPRASRTLIEAGQPIWLEVAVKWPSNVPSAAEYEIVPMATTGHSSGDVACLNCAWHIEQVGGAPSAPRAGASTAGAATPPAAGAASASPSPDGIAGRAGPGSGAAPATAPSAGSWGAAPVSTVSSGATATTNVAELHHVFVLPPGQDSGTFRVTVQASQDAYFEPATFTMMVEVKSTAAAMAGLRDAAFGELGAHHVPPTPEPFAATGSGDDSEGWRTTGQLPASFVPSGPNTPDPRASTRTAERKRLEATRMYLQANGGSPDVLAAVDRALAASRATEAALASDRSKAWQPFQVRGTYLSREDDVPSGPLTLYGTVRAEAPHSSAGGEVVSDSPGQVVVQIRDLSRRFDNEDLTFTGQGQTFDSALKAAFVDNAKAYPTGVMAIEAEAIDASVPGDYAVIGNGTGKTIGFQLGTDSRWKRVKDKVWSPVVNTVVNLGAMALMAFVPGSAVIVAPALIAYNSAPVIDRMRSKSDSGTLTLGEAATSVGEIALNLLPMAGRAKAFTASWFVLEGANWGGQAVLLTASAIEAARALQSRDVEALAALYEELQKLETAAADPAAIETKREQVIARAKKVSQRIEEQIQEQIGTNAMFAVAGSVIHRAGTLSAAGREQMIDGYLRKRGAAAPGGDHQATGATNEHGPHHESGRDATDPPTSGAASERDASHGPDESGRGVPHQPKPPLDPPSVLDGVAIAAQVPATTYEAGGTFRIKTVHGEAEVAVRRTSGATRVVRNGDSITIEIPRGLTGSALAHTVVDQLRVALAESVQGNGTIGTAGTKHADPAAVRSTPREPTGRQESLPPPIYSFQELGADHNRIVGNPVSLEQGHDILRAIVAGDPTALTKLGLSGTPRLPQTSSTEFGLGRTADGLVVVVCGEPHAVDWSKLPGVTAEGHTHPDVRNNDIRPTDHGNRVPVDELLQPTDVPLLNRELVFPSADDFIFTSYHGIDGHKVFTPFVVKEGFVMKAAGHAGARLEFVIHKPMEIGILPNGQRVHHAVLDGIVGKDTVLHTDIWIVQNTHDTSGHLHMTEPAGIVRTSHAEPTGPHAVDGPGDPRTRTTASDPPPRVAGPTVEIPTADLTNLHQRVFDHVKTVVDGIQDATPDVSVRLTQVGREAAQNAYREKRAANMAAPGARKHAGDAAKRVVKAAALVEAETLARRRAEQSVADGSVFDMSKLPRDAQTQLSRFRAGQSGGTAASMGPKLAGMDMATMETILDAELTTTGGSKTPQRIRDPLNPAVPQIQQVYQFNDGTLIRLKPRGDDHNPGTPMFSIEVKQVPPSDALVGQGGVAFKVDKHGRPVPKGGFEILNPYERGRYQHQHEVFEQAVLNESHQEAVPANNQSHQEAVPE